MIKMQFHFTRVADSDITTEGNSPGECYQKAIEERENQFKAVLFPSTGGKIIDEISLVNPVRKLDV